MAIVFWPYQPLWQIFGGEQKIIPRFKAVI